MTVDYIIWDVDRVTLNAANNYQAVAPFTVYFDRNYSGQFTVTVYWSEEVTTTLTLTGNGTGTYTENFLVRAEDWFTSANNTDTNISLDLSSRGTAGANGLGVYLEDAAPECTSFSFVSDWSDPTVFIQQVTGVTATATFDLKFGATIEEAHIYSLFASGSTLYLSLSQSGDVWTGTRNAPTFMAWGVGDIRLEATDSRGNACIFYNFSGNPITVYKHGVITLNIDAYRCDSNGDRDLGGGYIAVTAYATPNPAEVMPAISLVRVGILDGNGVTVVSRRWVNNGEKVILGGGTLDPTIAYSVVADANDGYSGSQKTKTFAIPPVNRIINVKEGGTGIAFGKLATEDSLVDSAWAIAGTEFLGIRYDGVSTEAPKVKMIDFDGAHAGDMIAATSNVSAIGKRRARTFRWRQFGIDTTTGERQSYFESYTLPTGPINLTENHAYNILTTKNINDIPLNVDYVSGTGSHSGTSGFVDLDTVTISTAGIYLIEAHFSTTRTGYAADKRRSVTFTGQITLSSGEYWRNSGTLDVLGVSLTALYQIAAGTTITFKAAQTTNDSTVTLQSQTHGVQYHIIRLR